ncbi:Helix-turn-helix domain protein [Shewanella sp. P1-14-1]|uniref:helix-turn-helix domain-containing protein n=1 Tax=Shewanella sp. P1-14-1 TaxID=1723761 RepID=UPI0006D65E8C|nr:AraC family transcriptional regulator [Shewanella sp. P1-14-1]KPZ69465.1 Helix-turn-helix domain protein [Shewanella sp. P1-14-1]
MAFEVSFIRVCCILPVLKGVEAHYGITAKDLSIPQSLLNEPMTLIPFSEVSMWLSKIEQLSNVQDYMLTLQHYLTVNQFNMPNNWFLATPDLAITFRRINYAMACFHSGASYYGAQSNKIIKWCYRNNYVSGKAKSHDSLRIALTLLNTCKHFLGKDFTPIKVMLSGPAINQQESEAVFGTKVTWNAPQTEIWLDVDSLISSEQHFLASLSTSQHIQRNNKSSISLNQLDSYLNMPQPHDTPKVLYELVNYIRFYGLPTLDSLSELCGFSKQQLQRRLQRNGFSFTELMRYILGNLAVKYMLEGKEVKEISQLLGYASVRSFSKSFRRLHHQSPTQYVEKLHQKSPQ